MGGTGLIPNSEIDTRTLPVQPSICNPYVGPMPSDFIHKGVTFTVARRYDDLFEITMKLDGKSIRSKVRTRLPELAKRRAEMLINRKVKDRSRPT